MATTELDRFGAGIDPVDDAGIVMGCESASYKSDIDNEGELLDESWSDVSECNFSDTVESRE